jgi:ABC-type multidrug transport system fused ATPase/permease subunit
MSVKYFYKRLRQLDAGALGRPGPPARTPARARKRHVADAQLCPGGARIPGFAKENNRFLQKALEHTRWNANTFAAVNTVTDIAPLMVIAYAGYQVIGGTLTIGTLVAFYAYLERLYTPLRRLVNSSTTLTQAVASMDRMFEFIDESYDIVDKPGAGGSRSIRRRGGFAAKSALKTFRFAIGRMGRWCWKRQFDDQSGRDGRHRRHVGRRQVLLISLLPRFWDVTEGRITIDGVDIRDVQQQNLRSHIGMVLQDNILFSESARVNILMGNPDADEAVIEAAKAANAHEFIMELPDGYDTELGERGVKLSGGQKQRIAIARVFLRDPAILILDEATSALDLESEHMIQESLARLTKGRTTIIVAHRLSTITHADKIVVMKEGRIVEQGRHEELLALKGVYHNLWSVQDLGAPTAEHPVS